MTAFSIARPTLVGITNNPAHTISKTVWEAPLTAVGGELAPVNGGTGVTSLAALKTALSLDNVTQAALDAKSGVTRTRNAQTGTAYTLVLTDAGNIVSMNNAAANTLTVPANASVAYPTGTQVDLLQLGAGQTTVAAAGGVTIRSSGGKLKILGQYSAASLLKLATDEWLLMGDITA